MNQVGTIINSVQLIIILGFVFCMVNMILNHIFKMKAMKISNTELEKYFALGKQLITGLGILIALLFAALVFMNILQSWNAQSAVDITVNAYPHARRTIINELTNAVRLLVIFSFVTVGVKFILKYREHTTKLKNSDSQTIHPTSNDKNDLTLGNSTASYDRWEV